MKRVLLIGTGTVLAMVLVVFAAGTVLPLNHEVTRGVTVAASPQAVWAVVANLPGQPRWRPELLRVERVETSPPRDLWREVSRNGETLLLETTTVAPPNQLVRTVADPAAPFSGSWEIRLEPVAEGTRISVTERASIPNPVFRVAARLFHDQGATADLYLADLATQFNAIPPAGPSP